MTGIIEESSSRARLPAGPIVIAQRSDQLGGRLSAIANARSFAEVLGLEFRFAWPVGQDAHVNDPREILSQAFLDEFEIEPSELHGRVGVPWWELIPLRRSEALRAVADAGEDAFVEASEPFAIIRRVDESTSMASERYRRYFETIGWSDTVRAVAAFCARWAAGRSIAAVHVRAGDIVGGGWRFVMGHEKYAPTPFIHEAIDRLSGHGTNEILLLSDNGEYLGWLKEQCPTAITAAEIIPGYCDLTELQRALADILLLAGCDPIVGPPSSAFSRLAANLGPGEIVRADRVVAAGHERSFLRTAISDNNRLAASRFGPALLARDVCWFLDVFGDTIPLRERRELADEAAQLDPDFLAAHARVARIAAVEGDLCLAARAVARGREIAELADRYDDPLLEALATEIACGCFAAVRAALGESDDSAPGVVATLADLSGALARCVDLRPVWFAAGHVCDALRSLVAVAKRVAGGTVDERRRAAERLDASDYDALDLVGLRASGLVAHRSEPTYDPLTRDLDAMALHLYEAVDGADLGIEPPRLARDSFVRVCPGAPG